MAARTRSLVLLFLAIASGLAAAWLSLRYLRSQAEPLLNPTVVAGRAVVAARDLPVGTIVTEQDVRLVEWPGNAVPAGLASARENVIGRGVLATVRLNEPFLESKLAPRGLGGGLPTLIEDGMRALSIRVDDVMGVAGFVVPGTRVDILLTMQPTTGVADPTTKAILQNIQTLAAGQSIQVDAQGAPQQVPVVTLLVTPEQAETLTLAANQGRIQLTLRNALDTLEVQTLGVRSGALFGNQRPATALANNPNWRRTTVTARPPVVEETIVEGFRGGERTLTRFSRPTVPPDQPEQPEQREEQ
jgi:pilus assembly protein CpaB